MIEKERIEAVKRSVDLVALIKSRGVTLKKNGKGYKGHCPFHDDQKTPSLSVTPDKNLWQCFGCNASGDAIRFVELFDKVDFKQAVRELEGIVVGAGSAGKERAVKKISIPLAGESSTPKPLTTAHFKLLARVVDFYHTAFSEDPRASEYLADRGIADKQILADYKVGFANGTLLNVLPDEGAIRQQLKELGILNGKGTEHFYGCVTFPLYDANNNPVGIYGRKVFEFEQKNSPCHLYLPGERKGIFNRQGARTGPAVHLTESILDGLSLINAGIRHTIPCYGVSGLTAEIVDHLKRNDITTAYICFDGDEAGDQGAERAKARLGAEGITAHIVRLPEGYDLNIFFNPKVGGAPDDPAAEYERLFLEAAGQQPPPKPTAPEAENCKTLEDGFIFTRDKRHYEVRAVGKNGSKLKATVKGVSREGNKKRFHVDTVDFYSARSRAYLVRGLADLFGEDEKAINRDMERLIELAEGFTPQTAPDSAPAQEITAKDKQEALRFLNNPDLLTEIVNDLETVGYTGEEMNKLLCYLAAISRKMDDPLSVMIQSRSAAGKSCLQDAVLSLIPDEDFIKYTRLTDQALFYKDGSLSHKILAIEELDGMNGALYSIRTIQSSKKITIAYTGKDPVSGKMKTEENTVEGPLMVFITTTEAEIDGETASRFMFISIDESREMTEKILAKQRHAQTMEGFLGKLKSTDIIRKHKNANRLLQPLKVVNPYAELLTFTSKSLRARRDHTKYLNLIQAIAYLFQYQRKTHTVDYGGEAVEYINVTLADIYRANEMAAEILGRSLDELSPPSRKLLFLVREMCEQRAEEEDRESHFTRRDIREFSGWSDFQVRTHIKQLEEMEYIYSVAGRRGKEYVHELIAKSGGEDGKPFMIGLVDMEQLRKKADELGIVDDDGV